MNQIEGGLRAIFPEIVEYFHSKKFDLVKDTGANMLFQKKIFIEEINQNVFLYFNVESKFSNFLTSYVILNNGKKVNSKKMIEFGKKRVTRNDLDANFNLLIASYDNYNLTKLKNY